MPINKVKLFEGTETLWPDVIDPAGMVVDGKLVKGSEILVAIYWKLEESFDENDHWNQLAIWAFHQAIPEEVSDKLDRGLPACPKNIKFEDFDQMMRENLLGDEGWKLEREIYFETDRANKNEEE